MWQGAVAALRNLYPSVNFTSSSKSFGPTAPCLYSSDTPIYFRGPSHILTPHIYTNKGTETECFQTSLRDHQQGPTERLIGGTETARDIEISLVAFCSNTVNTCISLSHHR